MALNTTKQLLKTLLFFVFITSCGTKRNIITKKNDKSVSVTISTSPTSKKPPVTETEKEIKKTIPNIPTPKVPTTVPNSTLAYINQYKGIAMSEMKDFKIPASITLAQGILESAGGKGRLAVQANNHFGIKCHKWEGERIYHDDDALQECFRKYDNPFKSFRDHSLFLKNRKRYAKLFTLKQTDYKNWAKELRKAGYATDPKYPQKLINLIEKYKLYAYDVAGSNGAYTKIPETPQVKAPKNLHTVKKDDTLYSLSKKYNTTVDKIKALNGLNTNSISIGQQLIIK